MFKSKDNIKKNTRNISKRKNRNKRFNMFATN